MGDISKNFSYKEFVVSDDYPELAAKIELTELDKYKVFWMVNIFLQPIRDLLNLEVVIKSAKRSPELNSKVGGTENSDHLFQDFSCAADFKLRQIGAPSHISYELIGYYWSLIHRLFWRKQQCTNQLIYYLPSAGNFIHFSLADGGKAWQVLYCASRKGRVYFDDLEEAEAYMRGAGGS